jgi:hypothetical protein
MADHRAEAEGPLPLELLGRGDSAFVDALRGVDDADALADFAGPWYDDRRPDSRRLLLGYLDRPLNACRHEGLIKRLFKHAEAAGDDQAMARFLVLFDRSIRRAIRKRMRYENREVGGAEEGQALRDAWVGLGYTFVGTYQANDGRHHVYGYRPEEVIVQPGGTTMPRGRMVQDPFRRPTPDWAVRFRVDWHRLGKPDLRDLPAVVEKLKKLRLFSIATRCYLRRRAWRYFRKLGKIHPDRYVVAVSEALALYVDEDVADGLALLDNWGLVHILFHRSPVLLARSSGWTVAPGRSMAELAPAPIFEPLWAESLGAVVALMARARSRTVVRWAVRRIEVDPSKALASYPLEGWIGLLGHDDPEVVGLAAEVLRGAGGLDAFGADRWLALVESSSPAALEVVCELVGRHVRPEEVTLEQAARLSGLRPLPVARLGLMWLKAKAPRAGEADSTLLGLIEAGCVPLRAEILRWVRSSLEPSGETVLAFLDSRHADARLEGWDWFQSGPIAPDDEETWRRLLESPYDDVRLALVAELESRSRVVDESSPVERALGTEELRRLWAAVLLNVHRGSRARTPVVRQILRRLEARPVDAPSLLPLLGVALRSARGPERRAGLSAVVKLVERRGEVEPLVRSAFPELQWA